MKVIQVIINTALFLAWLVIGYLSISFIVDRVSSPELSSLKQGMTILLIVWSLSWIIGGIYGMRYYFKKQRERLQYYQNYHLPDRLKLRDLLRSVKRSKQDLWKFCILGVLALIIALPDFKGMNPIFIMVLLAMIYNVVSLKLAKSSIRKRNHERKSSSRNL